MNGYLLLPVPEVPSELPGTNISADTIIHSMAASRPMAYSVSRVAVAPASLEALSAVPGNAVAVPYDSPVTSQVPYVVVTRDGNQPDEALSSEPQLALDSGQDPHQGFAPLRSLWWYRPEYADTPFGWITIGRHVFTVPISTALAHAIVQVSLQATPVGGRLTVLFEKRKWTIETNGADRVFSRLIDLGPIRAGQVVRLITQDPLDDVALLSFRVVQYARYREQLAEYKHLLQHAQRVIKLAHEPYAYNEASAGQTRHLLFDPKYRYRLSLTYSSMAQGSVEIANGDGYVIARKRLANIRHGGTTLLFDGMPGVFSLRVTSPQTKIIRWEISRSPHSSVSAPSAGPSEGQWFADGSAKFARHERVVVVNESYGTEFVSSAPVSAHVPSIFGTNIYSIAGSGPILIANGHLGPEKYAYVFGCAILIVALTSLAVGPMYRRQER
jgi:hypothetical protein